MDTLKSTNDTFLESPVLLPIKQSTIKWIELFHFVCVIESRCLNYHSTELRILKRKSIDGKVSKEWNFFTSKNHFKVNRNQIKKLMISCDCVWILAQTNFLALNETKINRMKTISKKKIQWIRNKSHSKWWAFVKIYPLKNKHSVGHSWNKCTNISYIDMDCKPFNQMFDIFRMISYFSQSINHTEH